MAPIARPAVEFPCGVILYSCVIATCHVIYAKAYISTTNLHNDTTIVFCLNMALVLFHFGVTRISILRWGVFNLAAFDFHLAERFFHFGVM